MTKLTKSDQAFILAWAEAVAGWGLARSVGRLHGLLLVAEEPLSAEDMAGLLGVARSNISTSLRDLTAMGLVTPVPEMGERRGRFQAVSDPEEMAVAVFAHQKARLFDPARDALLSAKPSGADAATRLAALGRFASSVDDWMATAPLKMHAEKPRKKKKKKG